MIKVNIVHAKLNKSRFWAKLGKIEENWAKLSENERNWVKLSKIRQNWTKLSKIKQNWANITKKGKIFENWFRENFTHSAQLSKKPSHQKTTSYLLSPTLQLNDSICSSLRFSFSWLLLNYICRGDKTKCVWMKKFKHVYFNKRSLIYGT